MPLSRRELLMKTAALYAAPGAFAWGAGADVLSRALTPATLVAQAGWRPYPRLGERAVWEGLPTDVRQAIVARAESYKTPLPLLSASDFLEYHRTGNRSHFEAKNFERRKQLNVLTLAECVEGKGRFLARLADDLWATCEETFWGLPAHIAAQKAGEGLPDAEDVVVDLFAAETAATVALVSYLVGAELETVSPLMTRRVAYEVRRRVLEPCLTREDYWWMHLGPHPGGVNNWNAWICSNWMRALLLVEDNPAKRQAGVAKCVRCVDEYWKAYPADGGEEEGPSYWSRSPASYFECLAALVAAGGAPASVLRQPQLRAMGEYILNAHIAGPDFTNYGDAHVDANPPGAVVYGFGKAVGSAAMQQFGAFVAAGYGKGAAGVDLGGAQDLNRLVGSALAVAELRGAAQADALGRDCWYPSIGFMAAREQAGSAAGFYLAAQCAATGRPHGHQDSGSFVLYHDGEPVFIDVGSQVYTKTTFGKDRDTIWSIQSGFHNLPAVGGVGQGTGPNFRASDLRYRQDEEMAELSCNLATAYPAAARIKRWTRTMRLLRKEHAVTIEEDFELERAAVVVVSFMTTRLDEADRYGELFLSRPDRKGKQINLEFDSSLLSGGEVIPLTDDALKAQWGEKLYRLQFTSGAGLLGGKKEVMGGKWVFRLSVRTLSGG